MLFPREVWKDVVGYEGLYQVSSVGRVRSLNYRGNGEVRVLKAGKDKKGYLNVTLCKNNTRKTHKVHRLVGETFVANPENKPQIDHINTIKTDNYYKNLRWTTPMENNQNELTRKHLLEVMRSEETRRKISESRKGKNHPMYGKHHNEETRRKISAAKKGKVLSEETKRKLSEVNKGKHLSEETRRKMSEVHKGRTHSEEAKRKMSECRKAEKNPSSKRVEIFKENISLGIFPCTMELERRSEELFGTKLFNTHISAVCLGKRKFHKGFSFRYVNE